MKCATYRLAFLTVLFVAHFASTSSGDSLSSSSKSNGLPGTAQLPPNKLEKLSKSKIKASKKTPRPDSVGGDMQPELQNLDGDGAPPSSKKVPKVGRIRIVDAAGKVTEIDGDSVKQK